MQKCMIFYVYNICTIVYVVLENYFASDPAHDDFNDIHSRHAHFDGPCALFRKTTGQSQSAMSNGSRMRQR
jgi:hypothetical protein